MKNYLLLFSLLIQPIYSMDSDAIKVKEALPVDTSVLNLPLDIRISVLRIIMLNRLQAGDYTGVTHLIEKTKLHPGDDFTRLFERGVLTFMQLRDKIGGIVYFLYKAAIAEGHTRLLKLIQDEGCLVHVSTYADRFQDMETRNHAQENPHHEEQYDNYLDIVTAYDNSRLIQVGKGPLTKEQRRACNTITLQ
jgi:hypothetical protein